MSANDIRELENLDRIPEADGGDLYLINGNMIKISDAGLFAGNGGNGTGAQENTQEHDNEKNLRQTKKQIKEEPQ